ncbi:MAG: hypothetical protein ACXVJT_17490, partial [Thermoanaerobaculia bacterium]
MPDGQREVAGRGSQIAGETALWLAGVVLCVAAAAEAVHFDTPIDRALPLVVLVIFALSWCVRRTRWWAAVQTSIPIVIALELLPLPESARLAGIGLCVGA